MTALKDKIINGIIQREGGYVDNPHDSGGPTRWGITEAVARADGYMGDMRFFPLERAYSIYERKYLKPIQFDVIEHHSPRIAEELADTAVNQGVQRAGEFLQRSLNVLNNKQAHYADVPVDGNIGPKTINGLRAFFSKRGGTDAEEVLFKMLNCLQGAFYVTLAERREKDEEFMFGWFKHRVQ